MSTARGSFILLVEDEPGIQRIITIALAGEGYRVRAVDNAEDAFGLLDQELPLAVVSDVRLPGMDGVELVRRIRSSDEPERAQLPMILVSAYNEPKEHAANAFLKKPFDIDELLHQVGAAIA